MNDLEKLEKIILQHEGIEKHAYNDSLGFVTIGIGKCIDRRRGAGLTEDECLYLLRNDIERCKEQLSKYTWFTKQDEVRKDAIIELVFNLGISGFLKFKNTINMLACKDYVSASKALLDSKWAKQVGPNRSNNIADRIRLGRY